MQESAYQYFLQNWRDVVKKYRTPNHKLAFGQLLTSFLPFIAILVLMYFTYNYSYWITLALGALNSFFLVRIFIIQHDCGHQSFFSSPKLNNAIGFICSVFTLIPYKYWSKSHNTHHGHNGQLEPEVRDIGNIKMLTVAEFEKMTPMQRMMYRIYRWPISLFIVGPSYYILIHNRLPLVKLKSWASARRSLWWSNLTLFAVYGSLIWLLGATAFVLVHLPLIVIFGTIAIWFFYVQHTHENTYKQWRNNWNFELSALKGSTYYKLPKLFMWLTGNIGLHHIHHLNSMIPSYNLQRCKDENPIMQENITVLGFWSSLKCMGNKLWDERQDRMIGFREFYRKYHKG